MKRFTLQDLKSGHRVENRIGVRYIVLKDSYNGVMLFSTNCYSSPEYDNDLLCISKSYPESDIMKVFTPVRVHESDCKKDRKPVWLVKKKRTVGDWE